MIKDILNEKRQSDDVFIIIDSLSITFKEFNDRIDFFIKIITKTNYTINRLAIEMVSKFDLLAVMIGCNRLNVTPIILPPENKRIPNVDYNKISNADYAIKDNNCIIQVNKKSKHIVDANNIGVQCILFTSGSEGDPKAVELTYDNILSSSRGWNERLNFHKKETYLNILPLYHISGLAVFFRSIYFGFVSIVSGYNKDKIMNQIKDYNIDYVSVVPKIILNMIEQNHLKQLRESIKTLIVGGDGISKYIYDQLKHNNINSYISYGMTETSSGISGYFINIQDNFKEGFIGFPHKGVEISLDDKRNIAIQSNAVMHKYVHGSECNNIFITNDIGEVRGEEIYYVSREKDFIVSGGENISLNSIRNIINTCSGIIDNVVIAYKDNQWGEIPIVLFETQKSKLNIKNLLEFCKQTLPEYMIPKHFIKIDKIPYKNNKIDLKLIKYYAEKSLT